MLIVAVTQFFGAYAHPLEGDAFRRVLTPTLNSSKSSTAQVRASAVSLFQTVIAKNAGDSNTTLAVIELLTLPKSGKTAGPDHRVALYSMLAVLDPSSVISPEIVQAVPSLLAKESHDQAVAVLASLLPVHLVFFLRSDKPIPSDVSAIIAKEMTSAKPVHRRAFCTAAGSALWDCRNLTTDAPLSFAKTVLPALDANLKTVSANPLSGSGPLEGYISLAVMLGPLSRSGKFGRFIVLHYCVPSTTP